MRLSKRSRSHFSSSHRLLSNRNQTVLSAGTVKARLVYVQVIYFTDALDEYLMQHLTEYEDKKLQDASKDNLKIGGKESKAKTKELAKTYKKLTKWWKDLLNSENLEAVKVTFL